MSIIYVAGHVLKKVKLETQSVYQKLFQRIPSKIWSIAIIQKETKVSSLLSHMWSWIWPCHAFIALRIYTRLLFFDHFFTLFVGKLTAHIIGMNGAANYSNLTIRKAMELKLTGMYMQLLAKWWNSFLASGWPYWSIMSRKSRNWTAKQGRIYYAKWNRIWNKAQLQWYRAVIFWNYKSSNWISVHLEMKECAF